MSPWEDEEFFDDEINYDEEDFYDDEEEDWTMDYPLEEEELADIAWNDIYKDEY